MTRISKLLEKFNKDNVIDKFLDNLESNIPLSSGDVKYLKSMGFKGSPKSVDDVSNWIISLNDKDFEDVYNNLS